MSMVVCKHSTASQVLMTTCNTAWDDEAFLHPSKLPRFERRNQLEGLLLSGTAPL